MRIIIIGCGKVGTTILEHLVKEKHDVVAIDSDSSVVERVINSYDVMGVCGNGTSHELLDEAEVSKADLVIATTNSDELNMLACFAAKRMGAKHVVARIRETDNGESLAFIKEQLELSLTINPDQLSAQALYNVLKLPSALKVSKFTGSHFEMIELAVKEGSVLDGIALSEVRSKFPLKFIVCVIQREDKVYIPNGSFVLQAGDRLGIMVVDNDTHKLMRLMGHTDKQARDVIILGASNIAYYLAKLLVKSGSSVKIIDKNVERCEEFGDKFDGAVTLIHGDGTSQDLLEEEGLSNAEAFVSLTGNDEQNILVSFYAMNQQVDKVITKVNRASLTEIANKLGLDTVFSPRNVVADVLVQYARALNNTHGSKVETVYSLMNGDAEALEFTIMPNSKLVDKSLKELTLTGNTLIVGIIRGRTSVIPSGNDVIKAGDRVIVVTAYSQLSDIDDIVR